MTPADGRLLQQLRQGDEAAFRELYRLYTPRLFAVTMRLLSRSSDAEDAVQEAWLRAVRGLGAFRQESSFSTWLTGIGIRCALEAKGLKFRGETVIIPGKVALAEFADPDGNILRFAGPPPPKPNPPAPAAACNDADARALDFWIGTWEVRKAKAQVAAYGRRRAPARRAIRRCGRDVDRGI